jgi:hypothetical protein
LHLIATVRNNLRPKFAVAVLILLNISLNVICGLLPWVAAVEILKKSL